MKSRKPWRLLLGAVATLCAALSGVALSQGEWEMRVCADPNDFPASSEEQPGFENRIAEILADELHANLTYVWTPTNEQAVIQFLRPGECDVVMGGADGAAGLISTVAYYRTPYVFVYRKDSPFEVTSLEDETLAELTISTYPNSGPHRALVSYSRDENLVVVQPVGRPGGPDRVTPIMEAVLEGKIDLAILDGADAGYFAAQYPDELTLSPVLPEIVSPQFLQMFRMATISVRPGDEALRDRLNIALAHRWEDVQAVLRDYGVPLQPVLQPQVPPSTPETVRVGVVLPIPTGTPLLTDIVGQAAHDGARLGEDLAAGDGNTGTAALDVLLASSPNTDAAYRAAQRLVTTEDVVALVGGFGEGQARVLSKVAEERGVLFFNIGSSDIALRQMCIPTVFHIEASARMYLNALVSWFTQQGSRRWFIVHDDSDTGRSLYREAVAVMTGAVAGSMEVGTAEVVADQFTYYDALDEIQDVSPDAVLLLLSPEEQELFLAQYEFENLDLPVVAFPHIVTQTRNFITRLRQAAPKASLAARTVLWEAKAKVGGGGELNEYFIMRTGRPLDSAGWAAYAAIKIIYDTVVATDSSEPETLIEHLKSPETVFDVRKGSGVSFRFEDHQLLQPLYLVKINPQAEWGMRASSQLELVDLIDELSVPYRLGTYPMDRSEQSHDVDYNCP